MSKKKTTIAIAYDFDGTLSSGNMQEHAFIPELGITKSNFWSEVKSETKKHDMDEILSYMLLMLENARNAKVQITKQAIQDKARTINFYNGVEEWFDRINLYAKEREIKILHYIISSGLREMVAATRISKHFSYIFASGFMYDVNNIAIWPALAVNYTNKTQYLFRINKGINNSWDNTKINKFTAETERPIPFQNIIYIGDGESDIPSMKMTKYQGGHAIAVYDSQKRKTKKRQGAKEVASQLLQNGRADYFAKTDYSEGSELDKIIKNIIDLCRARECLKTLGKI